MITIGQTKRALEWWSASSRFRHLARIDPDRAGREYGLGFDLDLIRPLWDSSCATDPDREAQPVHPAVREFRDLIDRQTEWRSRIRRECAPDDPRFRAWRARQIARNALESADGGDIVHAPVAIELTDGCSVGCWFCGVGATRMVDSWRYTEANAACWRDIVSVLIERIGTAARWGLCYWATDPLDNPDYERFALDFHRIAGVFPRTTTAQAHADPPRVRRLLEMADDRGCRLNRFSVLSEPLLRHIYDAYSPDELTHVEIVPQMPGGTVPKADAGAFRLLANRRPKVVELERGKSEVGALPGTIACVSGFLLNMVRRTAKLISPCRATDRWPLGYIVFDEFTFDSAADLGRRIEEVIERHMRVELNPQDRLGLNPDFSYERVADGFNVVTPTNALTCHRRAMADYVRSIGDQLHAGHKTASQIAFAAFFEHGVPEIDTLAMLGLLFDKGVLFSPSTRADGEPARPTC